jgi:hypothetical protein
VFGSTGFERNLGAWNPFGPAETLFDLKAGTVGECCGRVGRTKAGPGATGFDRPRCGAGGRYPKLAAVMGGAREWAEFLGYATVGRCGGRAGSVVDGLVDGFWRGWANAGVLPEGCPDPNGTCCFEGIIGGRPAGGTICGRALAGASTEECPSTVGRCALEESLGEAAGGASVGFAYVADVTGLWGFRRPGPGS